MWSQDVRFPNMSVKIGFPISLFCPPTITIVVFVVLLRVLIPSLSLAQESAADVMTAEASLAFDDGNLEEALGLLNQALELYPDHVEALYYLGLIYLKQDKLDESLAALQKAYALEPKSPSVAFQLGVVHFAREEYEEAEPLLTKVFEANPTTNNAGYYVGFLRYNKNDFQGAIDAFKVGASDDPRILQLTRFYSGLALAHLGRPQKAAEQLEEAMRLRTVSPLIGPADRLRDTLLAAQEKDHRLQGQISVGGFYDSNVAVVPLESNDPNVRLSRNMDTNSPGILSLVRLDYSLLRLDPVDVTVGYSFLHISNLELNDFNILNNLGSLETTYGTYVAEMPFVAGMRLSADDTDIGGNQFLKRYSAAMFASLVETPRHVTTVQGGAQIKEFEETDLSQFVDPVVRAALQANKQSGTNWSAGVTHVMYFEGGQHHIRGGFQFDTDAAIGSNFDYKGYRIQAGGMYTLPWWNIRIGYDYDLYFRVYANPNTRLTRTGLLPFGGTPLVKQRVTEHNHIVRIEKPFPYNITVSLEWQGTFSRSNTDLLYDFDRQLVSSSVAWGFSLF